MCWGVVDQPLDIDCIRALSDRLEADTIVLAGPHASPDRRLQSLANVALLSAVEYQELPMLAKSTAVLIMPYQNQAVTRAMQSLKLKEHLPTGQPVVCRNLPALTDWRDACDQFDTGEQFAGIVLRRMDGTLPESERVARNRLSSESWSHKARLLEAVLDQSALEVCHEHT